ncbi:transcriptional regulator [Orenia metallireducens]|uniref:Transcriptional regulator n=1 Tax=Orenia metallireducens TaxID=1413210 RepID=A0A1C0A8N5_9FIRM|nr:transcriptional regulator [Orenia metallireducens]
MSAEDRRRMLLNKLKKESRPMIGSDLADVFGVSRQVIVQDIALLRAQGEEILATARGYMVPQDSNMVEKTVACKHKPEDIEEELLTVIKYGGRIRDVIVEHPIYGEIKGMLMVQNRKDLEDFLENYRGEDVKPLSTLTEGVHLHTIEALNQEVLELIEDKLREKGFLLESEYEIGRS